MVMLSRGRLGGNAGGITLAAESLGTDHVGQRCWLLALQRACQLSLGPWRMGQAVAGSEAPSGPSVQGGSGKSSSEE